MIRKIGRRFFNMIWNHKRKKIINIYREKIEKIEMPTIFSSSCIGGVVYHEFGKKFTSPTINLYMRCEDFIKFCENFDYYFTLEMEPYVGEIKRDYPICKLGDLTLFMVHYKTFEEARDKWNARKSRVNRDNIRIVATDRDGCNKELKDRFQRLPYQKVMFTHLPDEEHKDCFYIRGYETEGQVGTIVEHEGVMSGRRYLDQFDWVEFLGNE